jgi:hypothetical protein
VLGFFSFFLTVLEFELRTYTLSHSTNSVFCGGYFQDKFSWTICPSWLQNVILLVSASWTVRIIGVSNWCLACIRFLIFPLTLINSVFSCSYFCSKRLTPWTVLSVLACSLANGRHWQGNPRARGKFRTHAPLHSISCSAAFYASGGTLNDCSSISVTLMLKHRSTPQIY